MSNENDTSCFNRRFCGSIVLLSKQVFKGKSSKLEKKVRKPRVSHAYPTVSFSGLHLVMVVDPDVMEYVTTTSHHNELKEALSAKKSEIKWTPQNKTAVVVFRGDDETNSWQSECIELVQSYLRKFSKHDVEVKKEFWEAVKTQLFDVRACLGLNPPLIKPLDESFRARVVCMSSDAKVFEDQVKAKLEEIYREETRKRI